MSELSEITQKAVAIIKERGWTSKQWINSMNGQVCIMGSVALACGATPEALASSDDGREAVRMTVIEMLDPDGSANYEDIGSAIAKATRLYDDAYALIQTCVERLYFRDLVNTETPGPVEWNDGEYEINGWDLDGDEIAHEEVMRIRDRVRATQARVIEALECAVHDATEKEILK